MKKAILVILGLFLMVAVWYLFIKQSDYIVNFEAKTTPGTVIQSLEAWNGSLKNAEIINRDSLKSITQQLRFGDSLNNYFWELTAVNDSITQVSVGIKDPEHSLANKLGVIFKNTEFEKRSTATVKNFYLFLKDHLKQIKITIDGRAEIPAKYCAYVSLKSVQIEKAKGMMKNYGFLSSVLSENQVELNGTPFVEITEWNTANDSISYNFCFPIKRSEKLLNNPEVRYKKIFAKPALKATYNGNYITSDRAWYALLAYAKSHDIPVTKKPIEIFYNNPNMGGNVLKWKAEIFMPIKESSSK